MYELYIANKNYSSWSLRPWVLMRELSIAFNEQLNFFQEGSIGESFRRFSPTGKVPCLKDQGTVVWDSLGIIEYLAERHAGVWPAKEQARTWARCATAEMHSGFSALRNQCSMNCGVRIRLNSISPELARDINRLSELWNEGLTRFGGPFLAGKSFTAVDAFFAPVAFRAQTYDLKFEGEANEYVKRLLALPFMQNWYEQGLIEPIEPAHEADALSVGVCIANLRQVA